MPTSTRCKIARQAARKPRGAIIARDRSYHGATHLAMALSGDSRTQAQVDPEALGVHHVAAAVCLSLSVRQRRRRANAASAPPPRSAERIDALGADSVAAVIMEPNAGTNGIVAPDNYWPALRRAHRRARRAG